MALPKPPSSTSGHTHAWRGALIAALIALVIVPHYMLPATHDNLAWHEVHRHLLYAPILLAALWYNWRGGILIALLVSVAYFPHLLIPGSPPANPHAEHLGHAAAMNGSGMLGSWTTYLLAMISYLGVGGGVGFLFGRLRRANYELNAALRELTTQTRDLLAAEEQLRRADRLAALGQLTSGLAHEIRNPLASIRGAAEILGDADLPDARRTEFRAVMLDEIVRLDRVLGDFLEYARTQKREQATGAIADLALTTQKTLNLLAPQLARNRIQIRSRVPSDLPRVTMDRTLLQQVLLNLLLNAIQAMPQGGEIDVIARDEPTHNKVILEVSDNGPGIPPEVADQIFDPFFTTKPHGTGLGLAIVQRLLSGKNSTIRFEARQPQGARFVIELPY